MKYLLKTVVADLVFAILGCSFAYSQDQKEEISITDPAIREAILAPLGGCQPSHKHSVQSHVSKDGLYAMYGDLFGNGRNFAFSEFDKGAGLSEWKDGHWEPEKAWNIDVEWGPKFADYAKLRHMKVSEKGFTILRVGQTQSVVLIAGDVDKDWQYTYLVQFNAKTDAAELIGTTMKLPYLRAGYWVLYNCSARLSEWESWDYYRIAVNQLIHAAHWSDYQSVKHLDDHSTTVRTYEENGQLIDELNIRDAEGENNGSGYTIKHTQKDAKDSSVQFHWKKVKDLDPSTNNLESRYLFTKLTGLPVELYPEGQSSKFTYTLTNLSSVGVAGDADDIARLSYGTKQTIK